MTDTGTTEAAAPEHDGSTDERLTAVENGLDRIEQTLSKLIPGSHAEAEQRTERRLDRASSVEEQVAAELDKRDRLAREQADADREKADRESTAARLARLEEAPPAPPRLRRTRLLGWGDGRA